ncbi:thiol-disulfide oxidoreductase DCC family protein [Calycomorphotria hydatis]|uniref:Thiol-disulfide oxidoreductase DCC n=1 Tax=Calycomorphotria hydatis TaxID=2528027 RepID=A0A517TAR8_9PLAN|nr:DCC1-like thiol-disulfide oxidoreductase family protein [Calycomorphotria hydatis]QDT65464.1 hypothetical protein V22_27170 [Calycomorphotria hydatis]
MTETLAPADMESENAAGTTSATEAERILYFDGVCGMCNSFVDFVIRRDPGGKIVFAPLQGETAAEKLPHEWTSDMQSVVYTLDGHNYRQSPAVVRVLWTLGGVWGFFGWLLWLVPLPLRNLGYGWVARVRYRLFGKKEACRMPTPEERNRFLP